MPEVEFRPPGRLTTHRDSSPSGHRAQWQALLSKWLATVLLALLSSLVVCRFSPSLSFLEYTLLDVMMAQRSARQPDPRIAIVGIEAADIEAHDRWRADPLHPTSAECACAAVPRRAIGRAVLRLKQVGARVIVLDMTLDPACRYREGEVMAHDAPLVDALRYPGTVVLPAKATLTADRPHFRNPPRYFLEGGAGVRVVGSPVLYSPFGMVRGVSVLQTDTPSELDREESSPLELLGRTLTTLSVAAYAADCGSPCDLPEADAADSVICCSDRIPVSSGICIYLLELIMPPPTSSKHVMLINWAGPIGTFPVYSFARVVDPGTPAELLRQWFEDRIVLIGSLVETEHTPIQTVAKPGPPFVDQTGTKAAGDPEEHGETPRVGGRSMPGVEVHANALDTLLQHKFLRSGSHAVVGLLIICCSLLTAGCFLRLQTWPAACVAVLQMVLLYLAAALAISRDLWLHIVFPGSAVVLSAVLSGLWGYASYRHEAIRLAREKEAREAATETIVHDLKQPLAAISGLASAINLRARGGRSPESPELAERIQQQVERALTDIEELLLASPQRHVPLTYEHFDLLALAADLAATQALKSNYHEVHVQGPAAGLWICADPRYLTRTISNLIDNAIKYWPDGGTIIVKVEEAHGCAMISVIDKGIGISHEKQSRIFERFERAVADESRFPGAGIGLYSARRIAEAHGGTVEVHSEPGAGSTFVLRLPLEPPATKS